jgi:creatinine amidohydrolase
MNELARMTTGEAKEAARSARLAVLPVGSCEQHGPHLSLDTDTAVAEALARRIVADLGDLGVLCPTLGYGLSEHHLAFSGTLTLRPATYLALLGDIFESLAHHGFRRVLVVNGHGGNIDALGLAARNARRDHHMLVGSVMWAVLAADVASGHAESSAYGHACEVETSLAMALVPDRVRPDLITKPGDRRSVDPYTDPPGPSVTEPVWLHEWSGDGALGDPRLASPEAGREIADAVVERAVAYARRLADRIMPEEDRT